MSVTCLWTVSYACIQQNALYATDFLEWVRTKKSSPGTKSMFLVPIVKNVFTFLKQIISTVVWRNWRLEKFWMNQTSKRHKKIPYKMILKTLYIDNISNITYIINNGKYNITIALPISTTQRFIILENCIYIFNFNKIHNPIKLIKRHYTIKKKWCIKYG